MLNTRSSKKSEIFDAENVVLKENSPDNFKIKSRFLHKGMKSDGSKNLRMHSNLKTPERDRRSRLTKALDEAWNDEELFDLCPELKPENKIEKSLSVSDTLVNNINSNNMLHKKRKEKMYLENKESAEEEMCCLFPPKTKKDKSTEITFEVENKEDKSNHKSIQFEDIESNNINISKSAKASNNDIVNLSNKNESIKISLAMLQHSITQQGNKTLSMSVESEHNQSEIKRNSSQRDDSDDPQINASEKQSKEKAGTIEPDLSHPTHVGPKSSDVANNPVLEEVSDSLEVTTTFQNQVEISEKSQEFEVLRENSEANLTSQIDISCERDARDTFDFNSPESNLPFQVHASPISLKDTHHYPSLLSIDHDLPIATSTPLIPVEKHTKKETKVRISKRIASKKKIEQTSVTNSSQERDNSDSSSVTTRKKKITSSSSQSSSKNKSGKENDDYLKHMESFDVCNEKKTKPKDKNIEVHKKMALFDLDCEGTNYADARDTFDFNSPESNLSFHVSASPITLKDIHHCPSLLSIDHDLPIVTSTPLIPVEKHTQKQTKVTTSKRTASMKKVEKTSVTNSSQERDNSDSSSVTTRKKKITPSSSQSRSKNKGAKESDDYLKYMGSFDVYNNKKTNAKDKNKEEIALFDSDYYCEGSNYAAGLKKYSKIIVPTEKHRKAIKQLRNVSKYYPEESKSNSFESQTYTGSPKTNSVKIASGIKSKYMSMSSPKPKTLRTRKHKKVTYIQISRTLNKDIVKLVTKKDIMNNRESINEMCSDFIANQDQPFYKEGDQTIISNSDPSEQADTPVKSKNVSVEFDITPEKPCDYPRTEITTPIKGSSESCVASPSPSSCEADTSNLSIENDRPMQHPSNRSIQHSKQRFAFTSNYNKLLENQIQHNVNEIYEYGFKNYGNTCYANATLQALLGLKSFVTDVEQLEDIQKQNNQACMLSDFKNLCIARKFGDIEQVNDAVKNLLKNFCLHIYPAFKPYEQQDAGEFLIKMINQFEKETNSDLITENFCFQYKEVFDCDTCKKRNWTEKVDVMLLVPVGCTRCTVQELLDGQTGTCPICQKEKEDEPYQYVFKKLPRYLILNLNRYKTSSGGTSTLKIMTTFDLSLSLNIKCEILTVENDSKINYKEAKYDLTSVIQHTGLGAQSGHYTADVCHEVDGNQMWCYYNDNNPVKQSNLRRSGENCYILFYTLHASETDSESPLKSNVENTPSFSAGLLPEFENTLNSSTKHITESESIPELTSVDAPAMESAIHSPESSPTESQHK